jgi:hypothetical protein
MELLEMIGWVAVGFIPTLGALEGISKKLATIRHVGEMSPWTKVKN